MLSVEQALSLVLDQTPVLLGRPISVYRARGHVLAEPITSDIDSPPHDKSVVDGYAFRAADIKSAGVELRVLEEVTAGRVPTRAIESGTATRIMTGAPLPSGADAVVMVEQTECRGDNVRILQCPVKVGQYIMRRGASMTRGQTLLEPGKVIRGIEMGLLSEVGRSHVLAIPQPTVGAISTGNELVEPSAIPGPGQIRNSNERLLHGLIQQAGGMPVVGKVARDEQGELTRCIESSLGYNVVLITGGVSAGVLDLVPSVLQNLGVENVFHKVDLKPGKPLWFGVKQRCASHRTLVFGLPGNPVSALVCFELFVRPAIQKLRGLPPSGLRKANAKLTTDHQQRGERPTYWPASLCGDEIRPLPWKGSGDLRTLTDANCLAFFPAGERHFRAGEEIEALLFASEF
jgi:molybdopterin molybdotransferase